MPLEQVGIGAVFRFNPSPGIAGMQKASKSVARFGTSMSTGINRASTAMRNLALLGAPIALGIGFATKQFMAFEKQMSATEAITGATAGQMQLLSNKAKDVGAATEFTTTQVGRAMELMGQAGVEVNQIITSTRAVTDLASAGNISLALSAQTVTGVINAM